jgi:hypothetical protein
VPPKIDHSGGAVAYWLRPVKISTIVLPNSNQCIKRAK